jgi:hypothetical protein
LLFSILAAPEVLRLFSSHSHLTSAVGKYTGTNSGQIVVELDDMGDHFRGCVYAYDDNTGLPSTFAAIKTPYKKSKLKFNAPLAPLEPRTGEPTEWKTSRS